MKFGLDIAVFLDDKYYTLKELSLQQDAIKKIFAKPDEVEGSLVPIVNDKQALLFYTEPLLALLEQWLLKLPWVLGGDTETIPLRSNDFIFGLEPISEILHLFVFTGDPNEIEDYILEPVSVGLEKFADMSIQLIKQFFAVVESAVPNLDKLSSEITTLKDALAEAEKALKAYRLDK